MTTTTKTEPNFTAIPYTQCCRAAKNLAAEFPLVLDPEMPTERIKFIGPVYGKDQGHVNSCVPVDAAVGDRVIAADVWDSGTRLHVYEIVFLDAEIGDESAPWHPPAKTRRAMLSLVCVGRSHSELTALGWDFRRGRNVCPSPHTESHAGR